MRFGFAKLTVKLGRLENLDLPHKHVLKRVNSLRRALNLLANRLRDQLLHELLEVARGSLLGDDFKHLFPDGLDLGRGGVGGLLDLVWPALGEADDKDAEKVAVGGLDVGGGLDEGLLDFAKRDESVSRS